MLRYYRGGKAYSKSEPLYGVGRGNRVMAQKRISGPSADTILKGHVKAEKCSVKGCTEKVVVTFHPDGTTRDRRCAAHVANKPAQGGNVRDLLLLPWEKREG